MRSVRWLLRAIGLMLLASAASGQTAEWIWHPHERFIRAGEVRYFRRAFSLPGPVSQATLRATADDRCTVYANGHLVGQSLEWREPVVAEVAAWLRPGENVIAIRAENVDAGAGVVAQLEARGSNGEAFLLATDRLWESSAVESSGWNGLGVPTGPWRKVQKQATLGDPPWGQVFSAAEALATPASALSVPPGFRVELLHSATRAEGSWVGMTFDAKGRLYVSRQTYLPGAAAGGLLRFTFGRGGVPQISLVPLPIGGAMGLCWAFDSLYVNGEGPQGTGLYRLQDTNGDEQLDRANLLRPVPNAAGEHGAHAIVLGPDQHLYIAQGNSTHLIPGVAADSPYRHYAEDDLLPRIKDPVAAFCDEIRSPYGQILRTDAEGKRWEFYAGGMRNQYDLDFNADGELFTYDSDMEWDFGLPWYRPTRILHLTSGGEYGFREGTAKWPEYYLDSRPAVVPVGFGSPTGVRFGTRSHFPPYYQRALFALDWTNGRILAVQLTAEGASYRGRVELFLSGRGLPVTDLEFGPDGALYFITGGRGTQSGLYKVSYVGDRPPEPKRLVAIPTAASLAEEQAAAARARRRELEHWQRVAAPLEALPVLWPHLGEADGALRFAARVALEHQPVSAWRERALAERDIARALAALLALARVGSAPDAPYIYRRVLELGLADPSAPRLLEMLRVLQLALVRLEAPTPALAAELRAALLTHYPAKNFAENRELCSLLVRLQSPAAVPATLSLLEQASPQEEQIWFAYALSMYTGPWQTGERERYFRWFARTGAYRGGNSFRKYLGRIREESLARAPAEQRTTLAALGPLAVAPPPAVVAPARAFTQAWKVTDLLPNLPEVSRGRDFQRGAEVYISAGCFQCHHLAGSGGDVGPDLSAVGNRFSRRDLLEAILEPSKVISEQYASIEVRTTGGRTLHGIRAEETAEHLSLVTDAISGAKETLPKAEVAARQYSPVSAMPPGLLNTFSKEEVLDLLAYLEAEGDRGHPAFQP